MSEQNKHVMSTSRPTLKVEPDNGVTPTSTANNIGLENIQGITGTKSKCKILFYFNELDDTLVTIGSPISKAQLHIIHFAVSLLCCNTVQVIVK